MEGTFVSLIPTIVAVIFALITKEVFISLFVGIFTGAMIVAGGNPITAFRELFVIMAGKMGPDISGGTVVGLGNAGILIFILELGITVSLINKAGGTAAFGKAMTGAIKSKRGALLATTGLGCAIFMDDYFNRLAVGNIMKPVTDKFGISRTRLAYTIGSVSVSICILVPISSWASAITGNIGEGTGADGAFGIYLRTLACNFYPILTLLFLYISALLGFEPIGMKKAVPALESDRKTEPSGKAIDLILPIAVLIISSVVLMVTTNFDSTTQLAIAGALTVVFCFILYVPRGVLSLKEFTAGMSGGCRMVIEVIIILVFAYTLTGLCEKLGVREFVFSLTANMGDAKNFLPALLFAVAMGTSFATGTAWGTFGMLVPLTVPMFETNSTLQILSIAAVLSGAVFGNQVSPISDSTILASGVCECDHAEFIKAQLPSALIIAAIAFCGFLVSGVTEKTVWGWLVAAVMMTAYVLSSALIAKNKKRTLRPQKEPSASTPIK